MLFPPPFLQSAALQGGKMAMERKRGSVRLGLGRLGGSRVLNSPGESAGDGVERCHWPDRQLLLIVLVDCNSYTIE